MQVKIEKTFPIAAPADAAWRVLADIRAVALCMPGAQITEQIDDTHYKGEMKTRIGPASVSFTGEIEVKLSDAAGRRLELYAKGAEAGGATAATMNLGAEIRETGAASCELGGVADITLSGKLASFGGRMLNQVADQLLKQFGERFAARAVALAAEQGAPAGAAAAPAAAPPQQPETLDGLALLWHVLAARIRGLFGGRTKGGKAGRAE